MGRAVYVEVDGRRRMIQPESIEWVDVCERCGREAPASESFVIEVRGWDKKTGAPYLLDLCMGCVTHIVRMATPEVAGVVRCAVQAWLMDRAKLQDVMPEWCTALLDKLAYGDPPNAGAEPTGVAHNSVAGVTE